MEQLLSVVTVLIAIVIAVWRLEDRFVNRREFMHLSRQVTAIRIHLGVQDPDGVEDEPA